MLSTIRFVARHPVLRVYALLLFVSACAGGAMHPYMALVAIDTLNMSGQGFALTMFVSTLTSLVFGVTIGIVSDFAGNRRRMMAILMALGVAGAGLIWLVQSAWMLALSMIVILPFANIAPLVFAGTRMEADEMAPDEAASVNSIIRTTMSAAWVIIPVAVAFVLQTGGFGVMNVWLVTALLFAVCLGLVLLFLPKTARAGTAQGGLAVYFAALNELAHPGIFLRLMAVSLIVAGEWLNGYLQTLVIKTTLGGSLSDAGFMASGVALMEIPFMLAWAAGLRRLGAVNTILAGAALYASFLVLMGSATAVWQVHALIPLAGAGAAALLSVPLSYFQDLFPGRPGLGTSLSPIEGFIGTGAAAAVFAIGTHVTTYQGTAFIGAGVMVASALLLIAIERWVPLPEKSMAG